MRQLRLRLRRQEARKHGFCPVTCEQKAGACSKKIRNECADQPQPRSKDQPRTDLENHGRHNWNDQHTGKHCDQCKWRQYAEGREQRAQNSWRDERAGDLREYEKRDDKCTERETQDDRASRNARTELMIEARDCFDKTVLYRVAAGT